MEGESQLNSELADWASLVSQPAVEILHLYLGRIGITDSYAFLALVRLRDLNVGPHACEVSTSPMEPSP